MLLSCQRGQQNAPVKKRKGTTTTINSLTTSPLAVLVVAAHCYELWAHQPLLLLLPATTTTVAATATTVLLRLPPLLRPTTTVNNEKGGADTGPTFKNPWTSHSQLPVVGLSRPAAIERLPLVVGSARFLPDHF